MFCFLYWKFSKIRDLVRTFLGTQVNILVIVSIGWVQDEKIPVCLYIAFGMTAFPFSSLFRGEIKTGKIESCDVGIHSVLGAWSNPLGLSSFLTFAFLVTADLQTALSSSKLLRLSCEVLPEESRNSIFKFGFLLLFPEVWMFVGLSKVRDRVLNISLERGSLRRKDTTTLSVNCSSLKQFDQTG